MTTQNVTQFSVLLFALYYVVLYNFKREYKLCNCQRKTLYDIWSSPVLSLGVLFFPVVVFVVLAILLTHQG